MKNCLNCNAQFLPTEGCENYQKYCSRLCYKRAKHERLLSRRKASRDFGHQPCQFCKTPFIHTCSGVRYCSDECRIKGHAAKTRKFLNIPDCLENASRKLDKTIGYVRVYAPMHPEANTWGYVYEHRVIAEQMIGRRLKKNEVVHHKNGERWDNRPENLEVMDKVEHAKLGGQREHEKNVVIITSTDIYGGKPRRLVEKSDGHEFKPEIPDHTNIYKCTLCGLISVLVDGSHYYLNSNKFILCEQNRVLNIIK